MSHLRLVSNQVALGPVEAGFNARDKIALTCWLQQSETHGYRRMLIEGGTDEGGPEEGGYVLIYAPGREWASWGMVRRGDLVSVWHCGTGADVGSYPTMLAALQSLPPVVWEPAQMRPEPRRVSLRLSVVHSA